MSTNSHTNRMQQQTADEKLRAGLTKHAPNLASFIVAGATIKTADIVTVLQNRENTAKAVDSARATWRAAVAADRNERKQSSALVSGVKQTLHVMFAGSVDTLAEFGLTPRKPRVVSPDVKVAAAAKAKATRAARHTQGKVQKAQVKGTLDGVKLVVSAQPEPATATATAPRPAQS
jgi:hypothetical protein